MIEMLKKITGVDIRHILAVFIVVESAFFLAGVFFVKIPPENKELVNIMGTAIIIANMAIVYNYFFGSSKGKDKSNQEAL